MIVRAVLCAVPVLLAGRCLAEPPQVTPSLPKVNLEPKRTVPYASWTQEQKTRGYYKIKSHCLIAAAMGLGGYSGKSKDGMREEYLALQATCISMSMPDDWPGQKNAREEAQKDRKVAHDLNPELPYLSDHAPI
jgi:hypothetical protein